MKIVERLRLFRREPPIFFAVKGAKSVARFAGNDAGEVVGHEAL